MSRFEIKMPKLAESITEGKITSWSVKVGDVINEDDVLFEVETAKVSSEIPSPVAGKVVEILFKEGDVVPVGVVVAIIDLAGESSGEATVDAPEEKGTTPSVEVAKQKDESVTTPPKEQPQKLDKGDDEKWFSPMVLQLAKEANMSADELNAIEGTGYKGRLTKTDISNYISRKGKEFAPQPATATPIAKNVEQKIEKVDATPLPRSAEDTIVPMDSIRSITAERMIESVQTSAHVTTIVEIDVTKLVKWRTKNKDSFVAHEGIALTFMPAIAEATAKALVEFPEINASVDGKQIIRKKDINIGIAVALEGWNLIVPVIKNADRLNISGLAQAIDSLANKARTKKLKLDEMQGGTFTITNFGSFKNIIGTPIINQPEVAILGVGYIEKKPAVISTPEGDVIAIRHKMYLSLSYDHRVIDGALGGAFVRRIGDLLENWQG
ncbi:2-oxoglutarate dehydrogenase E2 component (dihydrolipoamide succinyltransferase) [Bacteroides reticulotermitis]|uniref:Dihydrolipoamide acetyltransferase component of pyruvate dehydrogenase complex n=1 Tax=Bacteroides reticulotermitis TaxID=1133319 RepID=A0A840CZG1_9BACE|nr:dihydrolipoamide acetyltransferase family protein [Bacteroides reticulotermitis]MBB4043508.1 2-oxoglutarate dehydrogenase E2 component (dihydrolipoamide succinyltransferase) [Bacteroides reticulotermitis]